MNPLLTIFFLQNPQAIVLQDGNQLFWLDNGRENSITYFPDSDLPIAKRMAFGMQESEVYFVGNFRFASTQD